MEWTVSNGWELISTIAQVLSLGALVFAIYELMLRRRQFKAVQWGLELFGNVIIDGDYYHVGELRNGGIGTARIISFIFYESRPVLSPSHRPKNMFGPGESTEILISAEDISKAWFRVVWVSAEDSRLVKVEWFPVLGTGPATEAWWAAPLLSPRRWFGLRNPATIEVGPTGVVRASFRSRRQERLEMLLKNSPQLGFPWSAADPTGDLPYVPLPENS